MILFFFCFFAIKHRSRVHNYLNRLGCVGPVGVPKKVFLAVVAGNVTT